MGDGSDEPEVIMRRLRVLVVSAGLGAMAAGCMLDGGVRRGAMITSVQAELGLPDVISDSAGDRSRFYVPTDRPEHEWAWEAPRCSRTGRTGRARSGIVPAASHRDVAGCKFGHGCLLRRGAEKWLDQRLRCREIPRVPLLEVEALVNPLLIQEWQQRHHPAQSLLGR